MLVILRVNLCPHNSSVFQKIFENLEWNILLFTPPLRGVRFLQFIEWNILLFTPPLRGVRFLQFLADIYCIKILTQFTSTIFFI